MKHGQGRHQGIMLANSLTLFYMNVPSLVVLGVKHDAMSFQKEALSILPRALFSCLSRNNGWMSNMLCVYPQCFVPPMQFFGFPLLFSNHT